MTKIPLLATGAFTLNSPVLGLYKYKALLVYRFSAVPVVAAANTGYRLLAVEVSLLSAEPPIDFHAGLEPL